MPRRARPLALTAAFWLFPVGVAMVGIAALLLVAQLAALPILVRAAADGGGRTIGGAVPLLGTGGLAVVGAVLTVRSRLAMLRHRRWLERRSAMLERSRTPASAGVSPGVAGTAHRAR